MSSTVYTCPRCLVSFSAKIGLDRHIARKKPCEPVAEKLDTTKAEIASMMNKPDGKLKSEMFDARDILRGAGITGLDACAWITAVLIASGARRYILRA